MAVQVWGVCPDALFVRRQLRERERIRIELIPNRGVCSEHVEHVSMSGLSTQTQPEPRREVKREEGGEARGPQAVGTVVSGLAL